MILISELPPSYHQPHNISNLGISFSIKGFKWFGAVETFVRYSVNEFKKEFLLLITFCRSSFLYHSTFYRFVSSVSITEFGRFSGFITRCGGSKCIVWRCWGGRGHSSGARWGTRGGATMRSEAHWPTRKPAIRQKQPRGELNKRGRNPSRNVFNTMFRTQIASKDRA